MLMSRVKHMVVWDYTTSMDECVEERETETEPYEKKRFSEVICVCVCARVCVCVCVHVRVCLCVCACVCLPWRHVNVSGMLMSRSLCWSACDCTTVPPSLCCMCHNVWCPCRYLCLVAATNSCGEMNIFDFSLWCHPLPAAPDLSDHWTTQSILTAHFLDGITSPVDIFPILFLSQTTL